MSDPEINSALRDALAAGHQAYYVNELDAAIRHYSRAREMDPAGEEAMVSLAGVFQYLHRSRESLALVNECLGMHPESVQSHIVAAAAYEDLGGRRQALDHLDKAIALDPENPLPWVRKARLLVRWGPRSEARKAIEVVERLDPASLDLRFVRVDLAVAERRLADAMDHCMAAASAFPESERAALNVGHRLLRNGNPSEAAEWFEWTLVASPDWWEAWMYLGIAKARLHDPRGATEALEKAFSLNPRQPWVQSALLKMHLRRLHLRAAWRTFTQCVALALEENPPDRPAKRTDSDAIRDTQGRRREDGGEQL